MKYYAYTKNALNQAHYRT
uniref:Uncharacterized protein n=1 Tax=Arundo donax TaxID=35708 RepID=A0A0A9AVK5_ARUDO